MVLIEKVSENNFNDVFALVWECFKNFVAPDYTNQGIISFYCILRNKAFINSLTIYGAYDDGKLVGMIATNDHGKHVALFFVEKSYQNKGIGKQLFAQVAQANAEGVISVNSSPKAVDVYKKLGFTQVYKECVNSGIRYVEMERSAK